MLWPGLQADHQGTAGLCYTHVFAWDPVCNSSCLGSSLQSDIQPFFVTGLLLYNNYHVSATVLNTLQALTQWIHSTSYAVDTKISLSSFQSWGNWGITTKWEIQGSASRLSWLEAMLFTITLSCIYIHWKGRRYKYWKQLHSFPFTPCFVLLLTVWFRFSSSFNLEVLIKIYDFTYSIS